MKRNLLERLSKNFGEYLEGGCGYDVKIHVGKYYDQKTFEAHSMMLAARSLYFRRKIDDIPMNSRKSVIELRELEIPPNIFKPLLRYIYTGIVPLHNLEAEDFLDILCITNEPLLSDDPRSVVDFILAADKLELNELVNYLQNVLIEDRTEWLYKNMDKIYARISNHPSLKTFKNFYKDIIRNNIELMFQSDNFINIPLSDVILMVSRDDLLVDEVKIWNQVVKWCVSQFPDLSRNPEHWTSKECNNVRSMMENFIGLIRWKYISGDGFTSHVMPYAKIFPVKLYQDLVIYYVNKNERPRFLDLPRRVGKIESNLIPFKYASLISQWVEDQNEKSTWQWFASKKEVNTEKKTIQYRYNLLIRGSQNGFSKSDFLKAYLYKGPTITLVRLEGTDLIIGGYNPTPWTPSEKPDPRTRKSFIFAFDNVHGNPVEVGRISKIENSGTYPIISITDKGLKFGEDLSLTFADIQNEISSTLNYHSIEYTLLENVQKELENPIQVKDYE
ncbi:8026_t:CDS:2, partial [Acaulospora morrowiae]